MACRQLSFSIPHPHRQHDLSTLLLLNQFMQRNRRFGKRRIKRGEQPELSKYFKHAVKANSPGSIFNSGQAASRNAASRRKLGLFYLSKDPTIGKTKSKLASNEPDFKFFIYLHVALMDL